MDFIKLPIKDIRTLDKQKLKDTVRSLRKELVTLQMDVYNAGAQNNAKMRNMRKTLARMLTVSTEASTKAKK